MSELLVFKFLILSPKLRLAFNKVKIATNCGTSWGN